MRNSSATFADDYVSIVTNLLLIDFYTTDILTKFEDIPYIRLGADWDFSFMFAKLQGVNLRYFEDWTPYFEALP